MSEPTTSTSRTAPGFAVVAGIALLAIVVAYFAFGMPGMDHSSPPADPVGYQALDPAAFAARLERDEAFVVNVHTPFAGEIEGTDEHIPSDRIRSSSALPSALDAEILLYCRTGSMSADAAEALVDAGYTNVRVLRGGMEAWQAAGYELRGVD